MTDTSANAWVSSTHRPMGFREFVAIVAAIMALNPLAMDLMLPALPNVAAAFQVPDSLREGVKDKRVVLIDDVMTTGATLGACAKALLAAGARQVDGLVLARTVL